MKGCSAEEEEGAAGDQKPRQRNEWFSELEASGRDRWGGGGKMMSSVQVSLRLLGDI